MKIEYYNLYTHLIIITKDRSPLIKEENRVRIEKYMTGIIGNHDSRLYAIYANPEHVHMLISRSPQISENQLMCRIAESTKGFIIQNELAHFNFAWQESASAFSVSKTDIDKVCRYILNQKAHHQKFSFHEEYETLIKHYQKTLRWESV